MGWRLLCDNGREMQLDQGDAGRHFEKNQNARLERKSALPQSIASGDDLRLMSVAREERATYKKVIGKVHCANS